MAVDNRDSDGAVVESVTPTMPRPVLERVPILRTTGEPALLAAAALALFAVAAYGGTYGVVPRTSLAVAVWWIVLAGAIVGTWPRAGISRAAVTVGALLLAFAMLAGASGAWGASAEKSFVEANRVMLYLGVFALVVLAVRRSTAAQWVNAVGVAAVAIAVVAVLSRLFPHLFSQGPIPSFLPEARTRLSFPVNYWNGLAILVALGIPPLLRVAVTARSNVTRGLAVAPLPVVASTIFLASSRTGGIAAVIGTLAFVVLSKRRWSAVLATAAAVTGSALAIAWLAHEHTLVNGPLGTEKAASEGRLTALALGILCATLGIAYTLASRFAQRSRAPSARVGSMLAAAILGLAVVAVISADPVRRFHDFKEPPPTYGDAHISGHLLDSSGNWRWQLWTAAVDEFERHPVAGGGAGSFEAWWAQHGQSVGFVGNAHSLYAEVLGELGLLGLLLLLAAFGTALVAGVRRAMRSRTDDGSVAAAATAGFAAFAIAAGFDWIWQLSAVSVIGMVFLAVVVGGDAEGTAHSTPASGRLLRLVVTVVAAVALLGEADLLMANLKIENSQAAARTRDFARAESAARAARDLEPWASTPYLQLALLNEQRGQLAAAKGLIEQAVHRDSQDWRLWLVAARIETKLGDISAARNMLNQARGLNPRSGALAPANGG